MENLALMVQHGPDLHAISLSLHAPELHVSRLLQCGHELPAIRHPESFDLTGQLQHITPRTKLVLKLHPNMIVNPNVMRCLDTMICKQQIKT